ncbi:MAG: NAD(P)H-dependent oxidoreductase [Bacillota bacterium]|nr:NAD(P)H-dependent oxidoreductase [Bacillota bacterium]
MKITVLHGQMHKGSTWNITQLFLEKLSDKNTEINEFFMPKHTPSFCIGCFNCFTKGEDKCPHADIVQPVVNAIEEADLVILESPCYVLGMSGQLKTFLDHMGYRWIPHRPHPKMFSKVGLVISTAAGAGAGKVTKALKDNLFYWGVGKVYRFGKNVGASSWETVKSEKKSHIENDVTQMAAKILNKIGNVKPGIKTKAMFKLMQMSQKSNNWNPTDKEHWVRNGWLNRNKPW